MVTQKDIAKRLGVSASLVSRALAGTAEGIGASRQTIDRICKEAKCLRYAPNAAALTLRGAKSMTIGVLIRDFDDPFFGVMIGQLQKLARDAGLCLLLAGCGEGSRPDIDIPLFLRYQLDALIACGSDIQDSWIEPFITRGLHVVQIGSGSERAGLRRVLLDESTAMEMLVGHLCRLGHSRIAFAGCSSGIHLKRMELAKEAMIGRGLKPKSSHFISSFSKESGAKTLKMALSAKPKPTAIIAADDSIALALLRAAHEMGIAVPKSLSIVGMDDIPQSCIATPSLSTARVPVSEMAEAAFALALEADGREPPPFKPELMARESSAKPGLAS